MKIKLADYIQEAIFKHKEQMKVLTEPDPEEKDDFSVSPGQEQEEKAIVDSMYDSVIQLQRDAESNAVFNVQLSGTTLTSVFFCGNQIFTANVGDSRSILISTDSEGNLVVKQLSTDHKPENQNERMRIINKGGKVQQAQDWRGRFSGPQRLWVKNVNTPGLAMSRSIGDTVAHSVGCSCEPEIT